jgi:gamma-glutamyltranspeptidase/glutathione hydrolase
MSIYFTQNWTVAKPAARSTKGIVVSQSRLAAEAGVEILESGGNAVDAAVATAFALAAVEPWNTGLGAIGFMVVHRAGQPKAEIVDFGPLSSAHTDPAAYPLSGGTQTQLFTWPAVVDDRNVHGPLSFAVPAAVDGYGLALENWGRKTFAEVLAPAIRLARRGLPQDWWATVKIAGAAADLRRYPESRRVYLPDDLPPVPPSAGVPEFRKLGRLDQTLERLARAGRRDFYEGGIAADIAADTKAIGGVLDGADLTAYRARVLPALAIPYRGFTVHAPDGMTAGPTLADTLGRLDRVKLGSAPDAAAFIAYAEAMRAAYVARLDKLGDVKGESCTTHLTVIDRDGTIVALTTTLLSTFGSRTVLPTTGILMNNGIMWFDPRPGRPNSIAPSKRPLSNMCPIVVARDGRPWIGAGASGGRRIMSAVLQLMSFAVDFGFGAEAAAHRPRIDVSGGETVMVDRRMEPEILQALAAKFPLDVVEHGALPVNFSCPNMVMVNADGTRTGISDVMSPWSAAVAEA